MSDRVNSPNYFNPLHLYGLVKRCPFAYILVERPTMEYIFLVSSESIIPIFYALLSMSCPCPLSHLVPSLYCTICFLLVTVATGLCWRTGRALLRILFCTLVRRDVLLLGKVVCLRTILKDLNWKR